MLHTFRNVDDVTGLQCYRRLAPLLIPALAGDTDKYLACPMMYVPVVTATRLESDITAWQDCRLAILQVLRTEGAR